MVMAWQWHGDGMATAIIVGLIAWLQNPGGKELHSRGRPAGRARPAIDWRAGSWPCRMGSTCCSRRRTQELQLDLPAEAHEQSRIPAAPHWRSDGSNEQMSPSTGFTRRRWPTPLDIFGTAE